MKRYTIRAAILCAAFVLSGCISDAKDKAIYYGGKALDAGCEVPLSVRGEVIAAINANQAAKGAPARIMSAFDCNNDGARDLDQ